MRYVGWNGGGERNSGYDMSWWNVGGVRNSGYEMSGWNVAMSSMKVRYGLYGYGGLGEWF